jgi:hypothetical protein
MFRSLLAIGCCAVALSPSFGQPQPEPKDGRVLIPLTLSPAKAPKPQGKYNLYPGYSDSEPGEKVLSLLKSFMEQQVFFSREHEEKRHKWAAMPLKDLPADVRRQASIEAGIAYSPRYATMLVFIDQGARYTRTEWNEWFNLRRDGINMLLPEVQKIRALALVIQLRMRGEIKNGEYTRAIESVKTLMGIAQAFEEHPTLIGNLVGLACATIALGGVEEMIQQPGCPNLYWSLSHLPNPVLNIRKGLEGERVFSSVGPFFEIAKANRALSAAEIEKAVKVLDDLIKDLRQKDESSESPKQVLSRMAADEKTVKSARDQLRESGEFSEDAITSMPALQAVIANEVLQFRILRDEALKWAILPHPEAMPGLDAFNKSIANKKTEGHSLYLVEMLLPTISKVKGAETRITQRAAYLRIIEAIRLYAADNNGKLPASLNDLKVPIPSDPVTGKPFSFSVKDGTITLTGANPNPGLEVSNRVYEIKLREKQP